MVTYNRGDTKAQQMANSVSCQERVRGRDLFKMRREVGVVEDFVVVDLIHGVPEGRLLTHITPVMGLVSRVKQTSWISQE